MKIVFTDNQENELFEGGTLLFIKDNWNDYGYVDTFNVKYIDKNYKRTNIGKYKIILASSESELSSFKYIKRINPLEKANYTLDENCLSIGLNVAFYKNLYSALIKENKLSEIKLILRDRLNDILLTDKKIKIQYSATRNEEIENILIKGTGQIFSEVNKTLFREDEGHIYGLNIVLRGINKSIIELFDPQSFKAIRSKIDHDDEFAEDLQYSLKEISSLEFKSLGEPFIENASNEISNNYVKLLKIIRDKEPLDENVQEKINYLLNSELLSIITNLNKIKEKLSVEPREIEDENIGHYTSLENLKFFFVDETAEKDAPYLRLTHLNQLNDPLEGKVVFNYLDIEPTHVSHSYVSCATTANDNLPMWNLYSNEATGVFLIYDKNFLKNTVKDKKIGFYHVCYIDQNKKDGSTKFSIPSIKDHDKEGEITSKIEQRLIDIKRKISVLKDKNEILRARQLVENVSFLFKNAEYAYEKELRMYLNVNSPEKITLTNRGSFPIPFLYTSYKKRKLRYSKIVLGPKILNNIDYIAPYVDYLNTINSYHVEVRPSNRHIR